MWMKLHKLAQVIAVGYSGGQMYAARTSFFTGDETELEIRLRPSSREQLRDFLGPAEWFNAKNQISDDLRINRFFQAERDRQSSLWEQQYALELLGAKAFPACNEEYSIAKGRQLFRNNCAACHSGDLRTDLTGPALGRVHEEASKMWFIRFTQNSQRMIAQGDRRALEQWNM